MDKNMHNPNINIDFYLEDLCLGVVIKTESSELTVNVVLKYYHCKCL